MERTTETVQAWARRHGLSTRVAAPGVRAGEPGSHGRRGRLLLFLLAGLGLVTVVEAGDCRRTAPTAATPILVADPHR